MTSAKASSDIRVFQGTARRSVRALGNAAKEGEEGVGDAAQQRDDEGGAWIGFDPRVVYLRTSTREFAQSGAVVAVQRASSDLKLNPHLHAVFLDGVYVPGPDGTPEFRALPRLSTTDVADALQVARARILRYLERRGVITIDSDADSDVLCVSEERAERDPALAQLAVAAVSGLAPAGPELRRKPRELAFAGRPVVIDAPLSVREVGFSLHAATRAGPADEQGRQALLKYILRPPLANKRLLPGPDGLVRIAL